MGVSVKVNGEDNTLCHKGSSGIAKCTAPDVCKTPSPGGPVPVPYPVIISMSSDLADGTTTVTADDGNSCAIKGSNFSRCSGDEAGTAGGVKSSTNMKEATWILYSPDVKMDGANACRLTDKMMMNHENTVCAAGLKQIQKKVKELTLKLCEYFCSAVEQGITRSDDLEKTLRADPALPAADPSLFAGLGTIVIDQAFPLSGFSTATTAPDAALMSGDEVYQSFDFKFCGDRWRGDQFERQTALSIVGNDPIEISCEECNDCCEC
jgi:Domain of unknown function (DUF4150)